MCRVKQPTKRVGGAFRVPPLLYTTHRPNLAPALPIPSTLTVDSMVWLCHLLDAGNVLESLSAGRLL